MPETAPIERPHRLPWRDAWIALGERGDPAARRTAILGHAMLTNRRSLDRPSGRGLASFLAARGWRVFTVDMPGHGESGPPASRTRDWSYDDLVAAMAASIERVHGLCPGLPLVVVGHSLCGHLTINARGLHPDLPVSAIVACTPGIWHPRLEPSAWYRLRKGFLFLLMELVVRSMGYLPARRLGLGNEDEARSYLLQFCRWYRTEGWRSADGSVDYFDAMARVDVPVLGVIAAGDRLLARPAAAHAYLDLVGSKARVRRVTTMVAEGRAKEPARDPDHMSLITDPASQPFWEEIESWMAAQVEQRTDPC